MLDAASQTGGSTARRRFGAGLAIGVLLAASGCPPVGPDYVRPDLAVKPSVPGVSSIDSSRVLLFTQDPPWAKWWEVFHDSRLEHLVQEARSANQDLRAAYARVFMARGAVRESFSGLLPRVGAIGAYNYVRLPPIGGAGSAAAGGPFSGDPFQAFAVLGSLSYEIDLWGRVRRALEAVNAEEVAVEEDRKAVELSVTADTAQAYFDLGEADASLAIQREAIATRRDTLSLVKKRVDAGFATELELRRAEAEVAATRAEEHEIEGRRAVAEHRLAILLGKMPDLHFEGHPPDAFELPPEIPLGAPASLIERRPDIRAAEARLVGRNARIGQAIAGYFPSLTIQGLSGLVAFDAGKIFDPAGALWAIGPILRIPIFEGGRVYAQVLEAEAARDEALASYNATVLRAFGEVADAVVRIAADQNARDERADQVVALGKAVEVAQMQYDRGLALYLDVLDSQRALLLARRTLVATQRQLLSDFVQLTKALGGGWTELPPDKFQKKLVEPVVEEDAKRRGEAKRKG